MSASILTPPVSSFVMPYPDYASMLANAFKFPDPISYPPASGLKVEQRFDSDNNTFVQSASTILIWPKTALRVSDVNYEQINGTPFGDNASTDAFGRLRASTPATLFDSKFLYGKNPQIWDDVVSDGSSVWDSQNSSIVMSTSAASGFVIRQTPVRFNYQPGKSFLVYLTGILAPETGIVKRMGMFQGLSAAPYSVTDGIYLEITGEGPSFNIAKTLNGVTTITNIPQSQWNVDPLNGTGSSGLTVDFSKGQILVIDYEWLGLGRVRFGFVLNGKIIYAHFENHYNTLTNPYTKTPNQPVRYEIRQTGLSVGSMSQICSSVITEGGEDVIGSAITIDLSGNQNVNAAYTPIFAIRTNPSYSDLVIKLQQVDVLNAGNSDLQWKVIIDPTIIGGTLTWIQAGTSGAAPVQYAYGSGSFSLSGGYSIYSNFVQRGTSAAGIGGSDILGNLGRIGQHVDGTPQIIVIAARGIGGTTTCWACADMLIKG